MAADQFTQIRNALFRDPRLSLKDKGLFGLISTHREGWGVTPESLATCCTDGVSAIKAALRNLERFGYLRRERLRRSDGTLGASAYYITDQPDAVLESTVEEVRRSEPTADYPPVDEPPVAEPPVDDRLHKKTNSKKTNLKKTTSPSSAPPRASEAPAEPDEGGGGDAPQHDEDKQAAAFVDALPYGGRLPGPKQRAYLTEAVTGALTAGWSERTLRQQLTADTSNAKSLAAVYRHRLEPENLPAPPAAVPRMPRQSQECGHCRHVREIVLTFDGERYCSGCAPVCRSCNERSPDGHMLDGVCKACRAVPAVAYA